MAGISLWEQDIKWVQYTYVISGISAVYNLVIYLSYILLIWQVVILDICECSLNKLHSSVSYLY